MKHLTENIIAVEVPEKATEIEIKNGNNGKWLSCLHHSRQRGSLTLLGECNPLIIGTTPLTEEQWKQIVEKSTASYYMNYNPNQTNCDLLIKKTAIESGLSLLESKGLDITKKYVIIKIVK